jgi:hypothetical protein
MRITLSREEQPNLVGQGGARLARVPFASPRRLILLPSYQEPIAKHLTKSARARTNRRRRKEEAAQAAVQSNPETAQA